MAAFNYPYPAYNQPYSPMQAYQPPVYPQTQQMVPAPPQTAQQANQGLSNASRPVSSREEAVAAQIPFDGSISVFTDIKHGKIYTKVFNFNDGSSVFETYSRDTNEQNEENPTNEFATLKDIDEVRKEISEIKERLEETRKQGVKKP